MTWKANDHADYVCKKVASRVNILGRVNLRSGVPLFSRREGTPDTIT